ncbi:MAG: ABC transporter permease [Cytophagaceae bacterium]|nr:ABC transporter permease [Gemmatimonadaceae bacterium]
MQNMPAPAPRHGWLRDLSRDIPFAARTLRRAPGFALLAIITIGLGIGANAAVFSAVDRVLLRPLPYESPDRLVRIWESMVDNPAWRGSVSVPNLLDWRAQTRSFSHLVAYSAQGMNLEGGQQVERVQVVAADAGLFDMLGSRPRMGRGFQAEDSLAGRNQVVVISEGFWRRALGGRSDVLGSTVRLDQQPFTVIGVMPTSFRWPATSTRTEVWRPYVPTENDRQNRGNHFLSLVGRLKDGVTPEQATTDLQGIAARLAQQFPGEQANRTVTFLPLQKSISEGVRPALVTLMVSVAFVLLIACANVANLQLARAATRQREVAVRLALGADRGQLIRQFLTESLIIALLGLVVATVFAAWGVGAIGSATGTVLPSAAPVRLDGRIFLVLLGVAVGSGVLFGIAPALFASPSRLRDELTGSGTKSTSTRGQQAFRHGLVVVQIALSLVLLVGAGLLMRAFVALQATESGMQAEGVLTFRISPAGTQDSTRLTLPERLWVPVLEKVRAVPGVTAAGMISLLPIESWGWNGGYWIDGRPEPEPGKAPSVEFRHISPGYFESLGIPLVQGRDIRDGDQRDGSQPIVVNQALATMHFPNESAIGQRIRRGSNEGSVYEIVGVAGSVRQAGLDRDALPEMYLPYGSRSGGFPSMSLVVKSSLSTASLTDAIRAIVRDVDPTVPVSDVQSLDRVLETSLSTRRIGLWLMGAFAILAVLLAATGLYGVISFLVAQRTREIGVRMALGADRATVVRMVLGRSSALAVSGIAIGLVGAFWMSRLLANQLVQVSVHDPLVFILAPALLLATALLAAFVPARRASRTDPMSALRSD